MRVSALGAPARVEVVGLTPASTLGAGRVEVVGLTPASTLGAGRVEVVA